MVATGFGKIAISSLRIPWAVFCLVLISASCCYSADVVFIRSPRVPSPEQTQLEIAANFYGLNLKVIIASSAINDLVLSKAVDQEETVGVVIAANALADVNKNALLQALHRQRGSSAPVLILGLSPDVDPTLMKTWSDGSALGCKLLESPVRLQYIFGRVDAITGQLADLEVPLPIKDASYLELSENSAAQRIASVQHDRQVSPVFIETTVQQLKIFLATAVFPDKGLTGGEGVVNAFLRVAPAMMFIRYCAGERSWHALHHYANLTIDDPWLRQPYGFLDYEGLLEEMEKHDFHTTIAFIPWNYDRSEPRVVSLFREHPERFSIAIHGNNHDHKEFTDFRSKPLEVQVGDLKQSLARMEKFRALTGIPYDRVMVFPHSIAPEGILGALKTYNYLATVNSSNVPQGSAKELGDLFAMRPITVSFAGFPSVSRYSVAAPIPKGFIAINEFLDNPLLFYAHSDLFIRGIDAFDGITDEVNKIGRDVQWRSLGDIIAHLYLVKLRKDSNYDLLAFSNSVKLENAFGRNVVFYLKKQEMGNQAIKSVAVDGQSYAYRLENGYLSLNIAVPNGQRRYISVQYDNNLVLSSIDTSHDSVVVHFLRLESDFRDIYLGKSKLGLAIVRAYNDHNLKPWQVHSSLLVLLIICIYVAYRLRRFASSRRSLSRVP
jgi:hypothetical protein